MTTRNPILNPGVRHHQEGDFTAAQVQLANRNSGIHLEMLQHDITPLGMHYLLTHFDVPYVKDTADWQLEIEGDVAAATSFDLKALMELPRVSEQVTLECAGNGRALITPRWVSQPWSYEAVGNAEWGGCRLSDLLAQVDINATAIELVFSGADQGIDGGVVHFFERSLSVQQALEHDAILAWEMNGLPLLPQHGFPLRLIVPGWYGMASVKWLRRITVIDHSFQGYQQVKTYRYRQDADDPGVPITGMRVKSLLMPPGIPDWLTRRRLLDVGVHEVSGRAWSGHGVAIDKVELGLNGNWSLAEVDPPTGKYSWQAWRGACDIGPGQHELSCRATDVNGQVQPLAPVWDQSGMGNNAVHRIEVWAE